LAGNVDIGTPLRQSDGHFHHGNNVVVASAGHGPLKFAKPSQARFGITP
jgi:hypothetical protein